MAVSSPIYHLNTPSNSDYDSDSNSKLFLAGNRKRKHGMMWHYICSLCCSDCARGLCEVSGSEREREIERDWAKDQANEILIKMLEQITSESNLFI